MSRPSNGPCCFRSAAVAHPIGVAAVSVHGHAVHATVPDAVHVACVFAIVGVLALCGKITAIIITIDAVVGVALAVM